jgi:hypothetical protein
MGNCAAGGPYFAMPILRSKLGRDGADARTVWHAAPIQWRRIAQSMTLAPLTRRARCSLNQAFAPV